MISGFLVVSIPPYVLACACVRTYAPVCVCVCVRVRTRVPLFVPEYKQ